MEKCKWSYNTFTNFRFYKTECGKTAAFSRGNPHENGMKYCPFCGRLLTMRAVDCAYCHCETVMVGENETCGICGLVYKSHSH